MIDISLFNFKKSKANTAKLKILRDMKLKEKRKKKNSSEKLKEREKDFFRNPESNFVLFSPL